MYEKLSEQIFPTYYSDKAKWWQMAKASIATIGPIFNSYRMIEEYMTKVYSKVGHPE
jgi:starch phosphorylase